MRPVGCRLSCPLPHLAWIRSLGLILLILILTSLAVAHARLAPGPLDIQVFNASTQEGLVGVTVQVGGRFAVSGAEGRLVLDGIPAGEYGVRVAHQGFDLQEHDIDLPAGERTPLRIGLTPVTPVAVTGAIRLMPQDLSLPGARIALIPIEVPAAVQGRFDFFSDSDGQFRILEIPPGLYRVELDAPGCLARNFEVEFAPEMPEPIWTLDAETQTAQLQLNVENAATGAPIPDAWVSLAEAWPAGLIAQTQTDSTGQARINDIAIGLRNWAVPLPVEGFAGIWQTERGLLEMRIEDGQMLGRFGLLPGSVTGQVSPDGHYLAGQWTLDTGLGAPEHGQFRWFLNSDARGFTGQWGVNDAAPDRAWNGTRVATATLSPIAGRAVTVRVQASGYATRTVTTRLETDGRLSVALQPLTVQQASARHSSMSSALTLPTAVPVQFSLPETDTARWLQFRLEHPANVHIASGADTPVSLSLTLLDADSGEELGNTWNHAGRVTQIQRWLAPGQYLISASAIGNQTTEAPITLRVLDDGVVDPHSPNHDRAQARMLNPNQEVRGYLAPQNDHNLFRFELRRPSWVRLHLAASDLTRTLTLLDAQGENLASTWNYGNRDVNITQFLQPGTYFAQVTAGGNQAATDPFSLRLETIEDDGIDDTQQTSGRIVTPRILDPGTLVAGTSFPPGDRDYYRIALPGPGRLHLRSLATVTHNLRILDATGTVLTESWNYGDRSVTRSLDSDGPQTWFAEIFASGNQSAPHLLLAHFEPADELDTLARTTSPDRALPLTWNHPQRGSFFPAGDEDWYSVQVDHPGLIRLRNTAPITHHLELLSADATSLASTWNYGNRETKLEHHLVPGSYFVRVHSGNQTHSGQYLLFAELLRAEPGETAPLEHDPTRPLRLGETQTWRLDQPGDRDRFSFSIAEAGLAHLQVHSPNTFTVRLFNALTEEKLLDSWNYGNRPITHTLEVNGPTHYRLELTGHGWSLQPGHVRVATDPMRPASVTLTTRSNPVDPAEIIIESSPDTHLATPHQVDLDATGDGQVDIRLPATGSATLRLPAEGLYRAQAWIHSTEGVVTRMPLWIEAEGPPEHAGVALWVDSPSEGQYVDSAIPVQARAMSYTGARISRVEARLNGQDLPIAYSAPYRFEIPWRELGAGEHRLELTAIDAGGTQQRVERRFQVSEYFDLMPHDGSVVTGNAVRVSWHSGRFAPGTVRYRPQGTEHWQEVVGESGRQHRILLPDLEPGVAYEVQPIGGSEPGPVRQVTRVQGLAFGQTTYGPTIARDYDQRFPISVRNHAETAMHVELVAGDAESDELLVGFVEEGATNRPFTLEPGEERYFTLSLNAQDALREHYQFPVRIRSDAGYSDEAWVRVAVRLPNVDLVWEDLGPTPAGFGTRLRLRNQGDTLTDLSVDSNGGDFSVSPSIQHGLLPAGQHLDLDVYPRLYDGFQSVSGQVQARAVNQSQAHPVSMTVPEGHSVYRLELAPEGGNEWLDPTDVALLQARSLAGALLNPEYIRPEDWRSGTDTTGDGRINHWSFVDEVEGVHWLGEDTSGDGQIDYVSADVGFDGQFDFAALRTERGWERTSLLDVWIETAFTHPSQRASYDPYDVDVVLNGVVVGALRQTLPEGNHRFRIPPTALNFNDQGIPAQNQLEVRSRGMGRGSYGMSSDFQVRTRLTSTPIWTVAESREAALETVRATPGLMLDTPDYSVASDTLELELPDVLAEGAIATLTVPIRNLGVAPGGLVGVALSRAEGRSEHIEIQRQYVPQVPVNGTVRVRFQWSLSPGQQRYRITVDPDAETADAHRANNQAYIWITAPGDEQAPSLRLESPAPDSHLDDPVVHLRVRAEDDTRVARVEARIDGGLWGPLTWEDEDLYVGSALLQPGARQLHLRALDGAGNSTEIATTLTVTAAQPELNLLEPTADAVVATRTLPLRAEVSADVTLVAARSNGTPWHPLRLQDTHVTGSIPLQFGANVVEIKAVNARGVERVVSVSLHSTAQAVAPPVEAEPVVTTPEPSVTEAEADTPADAAGWLEEGQRLLGLGDFVGALTALRTSHALEPNPEVADRIQRLELYLQVRPGAEPVTPPPPPTTTTRRPPATDPQTPPEVIAGDPRRPESDTPPPGRRSPAEPTPAEPATPDTTPPSTQTVDGFGEQDIHAPGNRLQPPAPGRRTAPPGAPPEEVALSPEEQEALEQELQAMEDDLPEIPEEIQQELDAIANGEREDDSVTTEVEGYDGLAADPDAYGPDEAMSEEEWLQALTDYLMDYLSALAEQYNPDAYTDDLEESEADTPPPEALPPSGLTQRPPPGRSIGVQHTQQSHHCTNRPNIRMPFQMPEWLKLLDLPEPGTEEYQAMIDALLRQLRDQGLDTAAFERFHQSLRRRALSLEPNEPLPTFLQSVLPYFVSGPERDEAGIQAWREGMAKRVDAFWLRLLASGDPGLIYQGLRARGEAFGHFDAGAQQAAEAAMDEIQRHQSNVETAIHALPGIGTGFDIIMLARRESLSGEALTVGQAAFMIGLRALTWGGPHAGRYLYNRAMRTEGGRLFFTALGEMGSTMGNSGLRTLARVLGTNEATVRDQLFRERSLRGGLDWLLGNKAQAAGRNFVPFRAGQEAFYRQRIDRRYAERFLQRMEQNANNPREFRRLAIQLQTNKTAQQLINTAPYSETLRRQASRVRVELSARADVRTVQDILSLPENQNGLNRVLQRHPNVNRQNVVVRARTITAQGSGEFRYGRDRDVWYEFVDSRTGERLGDVHHSVSGPIYNRHIERITGRNAQQLDHTVTSFWHPDAYATGVHNPDGHFREALAIGSSQRAGQLQRARDVADTARFKPREWFDPPQDVQGRVRQIGAVEQQQRLREGMRQTLKEYDRHVAPHLHQRGLGPDRLPPRLREGLDIFRQVQDGLLNDSMTPEQGRRMLEAIGPSTLPAPTPADIADDLADFIMFLNIWGI